MARRIARLGAGQRLFAIFGRDRVWDNRANSRPERGPTLLPERLVSGYEAFHGGCFTREQDRFRHMAEAGQKPRIMLIGCRYSRVSPDVIVDAEPGELFIVRNEPAGAPLDNYIEGLALASIVQGLANLRTFPWIAEREQQDKLVLHGAYFGISTGNLLALDGVSGPFEPIAARTHRAAVARPRSS